MKKAANISIFIRIAFSPTQSSEQDIYTIISLNVGHNAIGTQHLLIGFARGDASRKTKELKRNLY